MGFNLWGLGNISLVIYLTRHLARWEIAVSLGRLDRLRFIHISITDLTITSRPLANQNAFRVAKNAIKVNYPLSRKNQQITSPPNINTVYTKFVPMNVNGVHFLSLSY